MTTNVDTLVLDPDVIAEQIAKRLHKFSSDATSGELVYTPTGEHSYYRDLLSDRGWIQPVDGAGERQRRHREQMGQVAKEREARTARALRGFEYRAEPSAATSTFAPPLWLNELFATANRPGRVLAGLIPRFTLRAQPGVGSVSLPLLSTGTSDVPQDGGAVSDQDLVDAPGTSVVAPFAGDADVALQLLELSPAGAHLDWALFQDLSESYDASLELALLYGVGSAAGQILGVMNVPGINAIAYTDSTPTGTEIDPVLGQAVAQIGDNRKRPPQCWLMRTARWAWFQTQEDATSQRPFGLDTRFFIGNDDGTPDPVGGFIGFPVFLDDALPANLTATITGTPAVASYATGGTQDVILCLRPHDLILLESDPQTMVAREPLSGEMGVRLQMHGYAAAITRRPAGISVVGGSGLAVQAGE